MRWNVAPRVEVESRFAEVIEYFRPHEQFASAQDRVSGRIIVGFCERIPESCHLRERRYRPYTL